MLAEMAREAVLRGYRCDVVVHREELIRQSVEKLRDQTGIEPGVVWQGRREWEAPIRVLAHGTVTRYQELPPEAHRAEILFLDEAHHATAPGWRSAGRPIAADVARRNDGNAVPTGQGAPDPDAV